MRRRMRAAMAAGAMAAVVSSEAGAWDCFGHRMVTLMALDSLPSDAPAFLRESMSRDVAATHACEPDRWRGLRTPVMAHENEPDHYIHLDALEEYGLTYATLPRLRYEAIEALSAGLRAHPERFPKGDPGKDIGNVERLQGLLPYAIAEWQNKLTAAFRLWRILERLDDPARAAEVEQARADALASIGRLSHFVGDGAQPLHTTKHYNGWAGENPNGYTTERGIHAKIDGGVIARFGIDYEALKGRERAPAAVSAKDSWDDVRAYLERTGALVERVYQMEKGGVFETEEGKAFIEERLLEGAAMLSGCVRAAWEGSVVTDRDVADFVRYDKLPGAKAFTPGEGAGSGK